MAFRPLESVTVMNSLLEGTWGTEIRCPYPEFSEGEQFKLSIECNEDHYTIYFNDEAMCATFPYRAPLSTATAVELSGGSNGFTWDNMNIPSGT